MLECSLSLKYINYLNEGLGEAWALQLRPRALLLCLTRLEVLDSTENLGADVPRGAENPKVRWSQLETNLNAGVGEAWAGQTRLRLSPTWKLWSWAVTVENLGRELPMGSEQKKVDDTWHWPEWWHGAGLSWTGYGQGPGLASDQVRNGALSRKLGGGSSNGL